MTAGRTATRTGGATLVAALGLTAAGCGSSHNGPASYVDRASNGGVLIQWTRSGDNVSGTLSEAYIDRSDPTQLKTESDSFQGTINGSSITLTFNQGLGITTNWNGTLNGKNLTLSYTGSDGTVQTLQFTPGTIDDYNSQVALTRQRVAAARQKKAQQQAAAAAQQQAQQNQQAIDSEASTVIDDISNLKSAAGTPQSDLQSDAQDVQSMRGDVQTAYSDLQTTRKDEKDVICGDADTVSGDADTVQGDMDTLHGDNDTLTSDLQSITSAIAQLRSDWQKLIQNSTTTGYQSPNAPSSSQVSAAITAAKQAATKGRQMMTGYLSTGQSLVAQANAYAAQAQQICTSSGG